MDKGRIKGFLISMVVGLGTSAVTYLLSAFPLWLSNATDQELNDEYENERQKWLEAGAGDKTPKMNAINNELVRRMNEEAMRDPNYGKHHWTDANRWDDD